MPEERGLYPKMRVGEQLTYFARLHGMDAAAAARAADEWAGRLGLGERRATPSRSCRWATSSACSWPPRW
jgi:ABC-2 type transport system ATP-binding protein